MEEVKWVKFIEVFGREQADLMESYFKAHGIETELFQESYQRFSRPIAFGRIEIFIPDNQLKQAQKLYEQSGWDFEIREDDEDEE